MRKDKVIIMGAAGRDFHNFNTVFKDNEKYDVLAFTATQIPDIDGRKYPPELAGELYPEGIPIIFEGELLNMIEEDDVDMVVLSYSDLSFQYVMERASLINVAGANFMLLGAADTMYSSSKPLISVCAVRTGCGKSQTTRKVIELLRARGKEGVVIRHPMPYGDLVKQRVQRFATLEDLDKHDCTIEEREEYEPHIVNNTVVYAGVDYEAILRAAESEDAEVIIWDGGNNDLPFYKPDLHIVVADPHRAGDEMRYYPGRTNVLMADVLIINKIDSANPEDVQDVRDNLALLKPGTTIIEAASPLMVENPELIRGKRVLVIEDGPTLTHGNMKYGAGVVAARKYGAQALIDPRENSIGSIEDTYRKYPGIGVLLPAMGYGEQQVSELEATINTIDCDSVIIATPIDLTKLISINKPSTRIRYELQEIGSPNLSEVMDDFLNNFKI